MRYTIVEENRPDVMINRIQQLLDEGWELHGNLLVGKTEEYPIIYVQALIHEQEASTVDEEIAEELGGLSNEERRQRLTEILQTVFDRNPDLKPSDSDGD